MSKQSKVMGEVTNTIRFAVEYTKTNVVDHVNAEEYNLTQDQLMKWCNVIETAVTTAYNRSMNQIIEAIE